ncbi:MAG: hypothetical protein AAGC66_00410 [Leifsonia sp.]
MTPLETYAAHRSYPSPRSVFATNFIGAGVDDSGRPVGRFSVDIDRIHPAYGLLRRSLALLELGHLWMNLDVALAPRSLTAQQVGAIRWKSATYGEVEFSPDPIVGKSNLGGIEPGRAFDSRSSNPPSPEWYDPPLRSKELQPLLSTLFDLGAVTEASFVFYGHTFEGGHVHVQKLMTDGSTVHRRFEQAAADDIVRNGLTICADMSFASAHGTDESTLLSLGRIAQLSCLAAGLAGLAARPLRSMNEARLSRILRLPLDLVPLYQIRLAPIWRTALTREVWPR